VIVHPPFFFLILLLAGNVFVIAAIVLERHLQTAQNYLIVSLAVADLLVACLVMPLGAVYEVSSDILISLIANFCICLSIYCGHVVLIFTIETIFISAYKHMNQLLI
jgi:hypothetical protein